jgi:hypothetical protein
MFNNAPKNNSKNNSKEVPRVILELVLIRIKQITSHIVIVISHTRATRHDLDIAT